MKGIFDSHAHYDDEAFDEDRYDLLASLPEQGICAVVNCASDISRSRVCLELSERFNYIYAACGVHPHEASKVSEDWIEELKIMCGNPNCVAVGEIGLDYHYDFSPREVQLELFEIQIALACKMNKPIIVHDREAHEDTLRLLKKYKPRGVVHCFSGSVEMAREIVGIGMYIGLGGAVTFKNARKPVEVAAYVPKNRLLIETDCPYMAPVPFRGTRCDSRMIAQTAEVLAAIRTTSAEDILSITHANASRLFDVRL